jgi:hypothetical protein
MPRFIRKLASKIFRFPLLYNIRRVYKRRYRARSYYRETFKLINSWARQNTEDSNYYYDLDENNLADLATLISAITNSSVVQVQLFFKELDSDERLKRHISSLWINEPLMLDAKIGFGRRVGWYALIRILKPKVIIETGVHQGVGSCVIAAALMKNLEDGTEGKYYGTDIDKNAAVLFTEPYSRVGEILYGDSLESLNSFEKKIDFFINDSDHSATYEKSEYEAIRSKLSDDAIILGDNSHVTSCLREFSIINQRHFIFFREVPRNHWYPGAGIGISYKNCQH